MEDGVLCVETAGAGGGAGPAWSSLSSSLLSACDIGIWLPDIVLVAAFCNLTARRRLRGGLDVRACCRYCRLRVTVSHQR